MEYAIGSILVLIAIIIFGLILRKKVYDNVDELESWKMDIMNRNVSADLSRVKELNLSGETQERFESWKSNWDHILTQELPDIEEYLLDAEEAADRFRIRLAKKYLQTVQETLQSIEQNIDQIFEELDQLLESEQNSRNQIAEIQPKIKELFKKLTKNRYLYGKAEIRFEVEIEELEGQLNNYFELTNNGNYSEAHSLVLNLKNDLVRLSEQIEEFPSTYKRCKQELPLKIDDLLSGIRTMKEDGYRIDHYGFEKELQKFQERLVECVVLLEKGNLDNVQELVAPIEERLEEMYHLLEKEALAKSYVEKNISGYRNLLETVSDDFIETKTEVETLQKSYYIGESELEVFIQLEKKINQMSKQFQLLENDIINEKSSHIELREKIEGAQTQLKELEESQRQFNKQIKALRKDELEAKETVLEMRKHLFQTNRTLQKSNIPGVPAFLWDLLQEATKKVDETVECLEQQPLDMAKVQQRLMEADQAIGTMIDQTEQVLEQARLVELVIQYANRYRSQYALLAAKLSEAEWSFRNYEYETALEIAAEALEAVEPGALKRLEELTVVTS